MPVNPRRSRLRLRNLPVSEEQAYGAEATSASGVGTPPAKRVLCESAAEVISWSSPGIDSGRPDCYRRQES